MLKISCKEHFKDDIYMFRVISLLLLCKLLPWIIYINKKLELRHSGALMNCKIYKVK